MSALPHMALGGTTSLLDAVCAPVALVDGAGRVVFANRALLECVPLHPRSMVTELFGLGADRHVLATLHRALLRNEAFLGDLPARTEGRLWRVRCVAADSADELRTLSFEDVSDRRRLRDLLRASDARLELAMAASDLAMWDWDVERDEVYYNDQWSVVLGIAPELLLQRADLAARLVLPADDAEVLQQFERHYRGETASFESEYRLTAGDGTVRWFAARARVVRRGADGEALRVIGVLRDVTRRRTAQQEAQEAQQRWERAVHGTSEGLYDWDLSTGHVWYATRVRDILGYTASEFPDAFTAFQQALHGDDRSAVMERIRLQLEHRSELDVRCRLRRKDGAYVWCRLRGQAERDAAGRPRRLAGSISDISAQIAAEEALRRNQGFYGTVLDSLPLLIAFADVNEHIWFANRAFQEFFGPVPHGDSVAAAEVIGAQDYVGIRPFALRALAGERVDWQGLTLTRNDRQWELDATFVAHRAEDGLVKGCFIVARDVTERRLLEAELRQSQKMEAIGRLTGGIAHDFNNLLSVILGNTQLLVRSLQETPRLRKHAETSLRAAMRGGELTRRLLAFARQQVLEPRVLEVNGLIAGMYELFRRTVARDIEIQQQLDPALWPVKADPGQLENAVLNLVINARDAMPRGGAIRLTTRNVECTPAKAAEYHVPAGAYAMVEITDSGTGMSPDVLKRACEPFFTTKGVGKGSGLGLSLVYGFVKQSGGFVTLSSTEHVGTTVQLYFPRAAALPSASADERCDTEVARGSETVLVVEDDAEVRETAIELLRALGYHTFEAASGAEALRLFAQHPEITLVFSDVMLPGGMLGTQVVETLHAQRPDLKVLLTSGCTEDEAAAAVLTCLPYEVLDKPYSLEELARRVRGALDDVQEEQERART